MDSTTSHKDPIVKVLSYRIRSTAKPARRLLIAYSSLQQWLILNIDGENDTRGVAPSANRTVVIEDVLDSAVEGGNSCVISMTIALRQQ